MSFLLPRQFQLSHVSTLRQTKGERRNILSRSKNRSSVLSCSNSPGPVSPSSSFSFSSSSSSAPNGLAWLVLFNRLDPPGEAKLVRPPVLVAADPNPPPNPANPEPAVANPEGAVVANGEGPAAAANPVLGFSGSVVGDFLKMEVVELPMAPKGEVSEPAKAAMLDEAKAELEVTLDLFESSSSLAAGLADSREPKGETAEVFANALGRGAWHKEKKNINQRVFQRRKDCSLPNPSPENRPGAASFQALLPPQPFLSTLHS